MTCTMPTQSVNTLKQRMVDTARAQRIPLQADIEIIGTCNFKCVHCYIAPVSTRHDVMSLESATVILDKLLAAGTMSVLLTGGEIFTHRQFKEIYLAAKRRGFIVYLNTNAYLIGPRWADFLAEYPPAMISISLYGLTPESYESLTGIPKSYERCVRAIDLLLERGIRLELKCPAMTITADQLPAMQEFAAARGVKFRYDPMITPQRNGAAKPLDLQLAPEAVMEIEKRMDPELVTLRRFASNRVGERPDRDVYQCGAGRTSLAINSSGGVSTCTTSRQVVANILEQSFEEVWAVLGGKVARKFPEGHPCATCRFRAMCAGCPATVEQLTGLPEGYVQQYCKITHLQAYELGYHETGIPRTVTQGIPSGVRTPDRTYVRRLPVLGPADPSIRSGVYA